MPLQNRVDPFGALFADSVAWHHVRQSRRTLPHRRSDVDGNGAGCLAPGYCCVLAFKDRHRDVWGRSYTELFFLDEVTALAAGHRPCFECRRRDAVTFARAWQQAFKLRAPPRAGEMDDVLHRERLDGRAKRRHRRVIGDLPDGALVALEQGAFAVRGRFTAAMDAGGLCRAPAAAGLRHG